MLYASDHVAGGDRGFGIAEVSHRFLVAQQLECLLQGLDVVRVYQQCGRRPLRVLITRSWWRSTRSTNSDSRSLTARSGSVVMATIVPH